MNPVLDDLDPTLTKARQAEELLESAEAALKAAEELKEDRDSGENISDATKKVKNATKELALAIFEVDDFREFNQEFTYMYYELDEYGMRTGDTIVKKIIMDKPR